MVIDFFFACLTIFFLSLAAIQDYKKRIVTDWIWIFQGLIGIFSFSIFLSKLPISLIVMFMLLTLLNIICSIFVAIFLYNTNAWGGADSKCIIAISISNPLNRYSLASNSIIHFLPPIIFILFNLILLLIMYSFILFFNNIITFFIRSKELFRGSKIPLSQKLQILFSGKKVCIKKLNKIKNVKIQEILTSENNWLLTNQSLNFNVVNDDMYEKILLINKQELLKSVRNSDKQYIWLKPLPPGIVFILISFISTIFITSPLLYALNQMIQIFNKLY